MKNARDFGFLPQNDGLTNAKALQEAVMGGGDIYIAEPGTYDLADQILLDDDTSLYFCAGSYIRRQNCPDGNGFVFINRGAYTRTYNKNIKICGLNLICNDVVSDAPSDTRPKTIIGLNGHLCFFYIKNLIIEDLECLDLPAKDFCIHICTFENAVVERVRIEGLKDAVHFGRGNKFVVRHGIFKTFDDPIALNAHDYVTSNPEMGWIENGLIEDCYDLNDTDTVGFFCRILAGSWVDWYEGMQVQRSDTVVSNGRLYRVFMPPDGRIFTSLTQPTHECGEKEYDGFVWAVVQNDVTYNCGCRNLHFKDIYLQKDRYVGLYILFDKDNWSRSYYPNSKAPVQENITFENLVVEGDVKSVVMANTPVDNIRFVNCTLKNNTVRFVDVGTEGAVYPKTNLLMSGTYFKENVDLLIDCKEGTKVNATICNTMNESFETHVSGEVNFKSADIKINKA
ncbi:MAG: hypothetical protein IJN56_04655 [Clostridia bacterium]|nr:hypothetical protein [Clostridia bacterium]